MLCDLYWCHQDTTPCCAGESTSFKCAGTVQGLVHGLCHWYEHGSRLSLWRTAFFFFFFLKIISPGGWQEGWAKFERKVKHIDLMRQSFNVVRKPRFSAPLHACGGAEEMQLHLSLPALILASITLPLSPIVRLAAASLVLRFATKPHPHRGPRVYPQPLTHRAARCVSTH